MSSGHPNASLCKRCSQALSFHFQEELLSLWSRGVLLSPYLKVFTYLEALQSPYYWDFMEPFSQEAWSLSNSTSSLSYLSGGWSVGMKLPCFSWWLGLFGDQPTSRSPPRVPFIEQEMFLVFLPSRNLQGFQKLCARIWGQRPIYLLPIISQGQKSTSKGYMLNDSVFLNIL